MRYEYANINIYENQANETLVNNLSWKCIALAAQCFHGLPQITFYANFEL